MIRGCSSRGRGALCLQAEARTKFEVELDATRCIESDSSWLYDDLLDGFIEPDFFERKSREWRQTQKRLADQITEYQEAANDYMQDGIPLLELSKKAYFLYKQQDSSEKRKLLNFVCSNSIWKDHTLTATFRQPFDLLAITNTTWQREKAAGNVSSDLRPI